MVLHKVHTHIKNIPGKTKHSSCVWDYSYNIVFTYYFATPVKNFKYLTIY